MRGPITKTCEACGHSFECGQYGCWCGTIGVTERQMNWIAARFQECLCPTCLKKVAEGTFPTSPRSAEPITHIPPAPSPRDSGEPNR